MPGETARSVGRGSARWALISARCSGVRRSGSGLGGMEFMGSGSDSGGGRDLGMRQSWASDGICHPAGDRTGSRVSLTPMRGRADAGPNAL